MGLHGASSLVADEDRRARAGPAEPRPRRRERPGGRVISARWVAWGIGGSVGLVASAGCGASDNGGAVGGPVSRVQPSPAGALHDKLPASIAKAGVLRVGANVGRAPLLFYATGTNTTE